MSDALSDHERAFLSALAGIRRSWSKAVAGALETPGAPAWIDEPDRLAVLKQSLATPEAREAMCALASQVIGGVLHSVLVTLDGDSNAPETEDLQLSAGSGLPFRKFLHEYLYEFIPLPGDEG
jgi:hypothetical protein